MTKDLAEFNKIKNNSTEKSKKNEQFEKIRDNLTERLKKDLQGNPDADRYIKSVMIEILKTTNDAKKDLTQCTTLSIYNAIKKAIDLGLEIDARQHCHLVKYNDNADLQIGYRGFIYAIKREYPDANIIVNLVREGATLEIIGEGDNVSYIHKNTNPFANGNILGGYCYISYTLGNRKVSKIEVINKDELDKIKSKAKQDFIWNQWYEEKCKVAIIRRACKIIFAGLNNTLLNNMIDVDNHDYDLQKEPEVKPKIIDDLPTLTEDGEIKIADDLPSLNDNKQIAEEITKDNQ